MDVNNGMELKENFPEIRERHKRLINGKRGCLVWTSISEEAEVAETFMKIPNLEDIDFKKHPLTISKIFCENTEKLWEYRKSFPDDSLPVVKPRFGTGIIGAMLFDNVIFGSNTSWVPEIGNSLEETIDFRWKNETRWFDIVIENLNYAAERMRGKAFCFLEGYHSPLEFASVIRGSGLYLELYTKAEKVHALLRKCDEVLMGLYNRIDKHFIHYNPGVVATHMWMEEGLNFLSDDAAGCISPEFYREFGLPYTDRIFERFKGGFLHIHTQAYHQAGNLCDMKNLTLYNWRQDPNTKRPVEVLDKIAKSAGDKIVSISMSPEEIRKNIDIIAQGKFIIHAGCENSKEQMEIIDLIHQKAPII